MLSGEKMIGADHVSHHGRDLSRLMPLVRHAAAHLGVEQTPVGKRLGLTNGRMVALAVIDARESCSMSELGHQLGLPSPLATRVAGELVDRGLVRRDADPADRRRVMLLLTERGRDALAAVHRESEELVSAALQRMTEGETESLLLGLRAFLRELHEHSADGTPPAAPEHDHSAAWVTVVKPDV
jgi:DNA-binding MarR family transcriptional regulator